MQPKKVLFVCYDAGEFNGLRDFIKQSNDNLSVLFLGEGAYHAGFDWLANHKPQANRLLIEPLGKQIHKDLPWSTQAIAACLTLLQLDSQAPDTAVFGTPSAIQLQLLVKIKQRLPACRCIAYHDIVEVVASNQSLAIDPQLGHYADAIWCANPQNKNRLARLFLYTPIYLVGHSELSLDKAQHWQQQGHLIRTELQHSLGEKHLHCWIGSYGKAYQRAFIKFLKQQLLRDHSANTQYFLSLHPGAATNSAGHYIEQDLLAEYGIDYAFADDESAIDPKKRVHLIPPNNPKLSAAVMLAASDAISCWQSTLATRAKLNGKALTFFDGKSKRTAPQLNRFNPQPRSHAHVTLNPITIAANFIHHGIPLDPVRAMQLAFEQ